MFLSLSAVPKVKILPVGDRYVKAGSTVIIDCQITDVVQLPDYIFWYHEEKRVMARHDPNLMVSVGENKLAGAPAQFFPFAASCFPLCSYILFWFDLYPVFFFPSYAVGV